MLPPRERETARTWRWARVVPTAIPVFLSIRLLIEGERLASADESDRPLFIFAAVITVASFLLLAAIGMTAIERSGRIATRLADRVAASHPWLIVRKDGGTIAALRSAGLLASEGARRSSTSVTTQTLVEDLYVSKAETRVRGSYMLAVFDDFGIVLHRGAQHPERITHLPVERIGQMSSGSMQTWGSRVRTLDVIVRGAADAGGDEVVVPLVPVYWKWPSHRELTPKQLTNLAAQLGALWGRS